MIGVFVRLGLVLWLRLGLWLGKQLCCIRHNIPRTINNTTALIKNKIDTHCQTGFVTYAKMHYIRLYIEHCEITNCYICRCAEL